MTSVVPFPWTPRQPRVSWNIISVTISLGLGLNIVLTPLKAYLCESFPWQISSTGFPPAFPTWRDTENYLVEQYRRQYNTSMFARGGFYHHDVLNSTYVHRVALSRLNASTPCYEILAHLHGGISYPRETQATMCSFMSTVNVSTNTSCFETRIFTVTIGTACIWITNGDDITILATNTSDNLTYYIAYKLRTTVVFMTVKLLYRLALTSYLAVHMWTRYYRHYITLARQCVKLPNTQRCVIVLGDPTSMFLLHPFVSLCLALDVWLSIGAVSVEMLAVLQVRDRWQFFLACVYLSRTVWFCYLALACTSAVLKWGHWAHRFTPLDPTLVAIAAAFIAGPLTYIQGRSNLIAMYLWVFNVVATDTHSTEGVFAVLLYTITIGLFPVQFGFVHYKWLRRQQRMATEFASFAYNDWKHRATLSLEAYLFGFGHAQCRRGGSMYSVFAQNPELKRSPCISQRGADCFVICYGARNVAHECIRLTLLSVFDGDQKAVKVVAHESGAVFGALELASSATGTIRCILHKPVNCDAVWIE
ncbi:hypothetical protein ACHHYP_01756 [Achlya hypogyna]|uniref:Transmembrane protein n=1 Tax=Achlya hypogyna TaxID=1202772 RepID=A0A1V9ZTV3_ACHHY|nr:hypothetical protein ACHHYP_01756 [Achlya hypogyna]